MCAYGAFMSLSFSWAAGPAAKGMAQSPYTNEIARVGGIQGGAKIQRAGEAQFKKLDANAPLYLSDFLSTERNSKIWWKGSWTSSSATRAWTPYPEATHGSLGENTVFGFSGFQTLSQTTHFIGQLDKGIARFISKLPPTEPPSTFAVATPTAWIEVLLTDRAADFVVQTIEKSRSTVTVIWGQVSVRNISAEFKERRVLTSCQEVDIEKDKEPGEIKWVSTDTMKNLLNRTTIPNTLPTDVPSCERLKTEVIQKPGAVYIPPPGAMIVPIPVPLPPTTGCPCPPGAYLNPTTNQCECCPRGKLYRSSSCDCGCPCPPGQELDPSYGRCVPCRSGATYDSKGCGCSCPCPDGQILLPGTGCVPTCPEGFTATYDTSEGLPRRCSVCVRQTSPGNPQISTCDGDSDCYRCETCIQGACVPKTCPRGQVLDFSDCACVPLTGRPPIDCQKDTDCAACRKCRDGKCLPAITCPARQRLNLGTCHCEPVDDGSQTPTTTGLDCKSNSDCGSGELCRRGKCVKRTPQRRHEIPKNETPSTGQNFETEPSGSSTFYRRPINPGSGIEIGIGGGRRQEPTPGRIRGR